MATIKGIIQYLKDPALVRRIQEALGVREIRIETGKGVACGALDSLSSSSGEESSEEYAKPSSANGGTASFVGEEEYDTSAAPDIKSAQANGQAKAEGSLSWLKQKARIPRGITTLPPGHTPSSPSAIENVSGSQTIVVETISFLDIYFRLATELGYEPFYITFLPFMYWNIDTCLSRYIVITWCLSMYIGQGAKQLFKIKRPAAPPAIRLEINPSLETEYGFPSTHATVGTTMPFCLAYTIMWRYQVPVWLCVLVAIVWCVSVSVSRLYLGVHSVLDVLVGVCIALVTFPVVMLGMDQLEHHLFYSPNTAAITIILATIFLLYIYPVDSQNWSRDRGDTGAILGSSMGFMVAHCIQGPLPDDLDPGPFLVTMPSIHVMSLCVVRFVVGLLLLLPTRFVMKLLCYKLLPVIMPTHGVQEVGKRPLVELPYKIITYGALGINTVYLSNVVFEICGISRYT